ncbi:hypothetical protein PsorP6_007868 [Peronosclerospora sorghi]|uniref:Uncharacterized protein n=1 Tax=Peronosclerospora sorghi TaxID=230839 RepID=A0ACC0W705_9STRA|nr:hypothetical protein PsorP6_007868 [Peronosclerospora sorghi]
MQLVDPEDTSSQENALDPLRYFPDGGDQYALFTLAAYFKEGDETPERRHFRTLHSELLKTYPKSHLPRDLPTMRNKKLNNTYVEEKRNELTEYMAQLMQIAEVRTSNVLCESPETWGDSSDDDDELSISLKMLEGRPGTIQFTNKTHNIGFSATFAGEIIRLYSREGAHLKPVKGTYHCFVPGTCTLTWDNTYTWSKSKVLIYWAEFESQNKTSQLIGDRQASNSFATSNDKVFADSIPMGPDLYAR